LVDPNSKDLIAIDVGDFNTSKMIVDELERRHSGQLRYILSTHWHSDHVGGNLQWLQEKK
jgi:glyoxylase-like metal-dependent hydrolase (beta-lactamase superfamily II)